MLVLMVWACVTFSFALARMAPGDPVLEALSQSGNTEPTFEQTEEWRIRLGLDLSFMEQYAQYLGKVSRGDLGNSFTRGSEVTDMLLERIPVTLGLSFISLALGIVLAFPLALLLARRPDGRVDYSGRLFSLAFMSMPGFWLALLLGWFFAENLRWLPTGGMDTWKHWVLPSLTLALGSMGITVRFLRSLLLDAAESDYMATARSIGLSRTHALFHFALPDCAVPLSGFIGAQLAALLGGAVVIETIFALPGLGSLVLDALLRRDYPVLQGYVVLVGILTALTGFGADLVARFLDPRFGGAQRI